MGYAIFISTKTDIFQIDTTSNQNEILSIALEWYKGALSDIQSNRNLKQRLEEVESTIENLEIAKNNNVSNSDTLTGFEELRNELFYLKYEILERIE